mmetsp:Transcript_14234/g.29910  ORF Transcript_14234/g.29910 Transcript_14234/m.29910 type:complete len:392 (-) Transcript_14234:232-1407(-)
MDHRNLSNPPFLLPSQFRPPFHLPLLLIQTRHDIHQIENFHLGRFLRNSILILASFSHDLPISHQILVREIQWRQTRSRPCLLLPKQSLQHRRLLHQSLPIKHRQTHPSFHMSILPPQPTLLRLFRLPLSLLLVLPLGLGPIPPNRHLIPLDHIRRLKRQLRILLPLLSKMTHPLPPPTSRGVKQLPPTRHDLMSQTPPILHAEHLPRDIVDGLTGRKTPPQIGRLAHRLAERSGSDANVGVFHVFHLLHLVGKGYGIVFVHEVEGDGTYVLDILFLGLASFEFGYVGIGGVVVGGGFFEEGLFFVLVFFEEHVGGSPGGGDLEDGLGEDAFVGGEGGGGGEEVGEGEARFFDGGGGCGCGLGEEGEGEEGGGEGLGRHGLMLCSIFSGGC